MTLNRQSIPFLRIRQYPILVNFMREHIEQELWTNTCFLMPVLAIFRQLKCQVLNPQL